MSLQMKLRRFALLGLVALAVSALLPSSSRLPTGLPCAGATGGCDVMELLIARETEAAAALSKAETMGASPLRNQLSEAINAQRARLNSAFDRFVGGEAAAESEVGQIQAEIARLDGIAATTAAREGEIAGLVSQTRSWPAGAARDRAAAGLQEELARVRDIQTRVLNGTRVNPNEMAAVEGRIAAYREAAAGPPVRLDPSTHHDPSSPDFRGGGSMTTPLPADAESAFARAIPEPGSGGQTWWSQGADGALYRYDGGIQGGIRTIHWNGTTTGPRAIPLRTIDITIKRFFGVSG